MNKGWKRQRGLTLIELLTTVSVAFILTATAIPTSQRMVEKQRLSAAAEGVFAQLQYARTESSKRAIPTYAVVSANDSQTWSIGVSENAGCDPTGSSCTFSFTETDGSTVTDVRTVGSDLFPGVVMEADASGELTFNPVRSTATERTIELRSGDFTVRVIVNAIGRMRVCSPDDANNNYLGRYPSC